MNNITYCIHIILTNGHSEVLLILYYMYSLGNNEIFVDLPAKPYHTATGNVPSHASVH